MLAALLGAAYLLANAVVAFGLLFIATFPFENQSPDEMAQDDWLIGVGAVLVLLALVTALAVFWRRPSWALSAYVAGAVSASALLVWAIGASEHSDGKLLTYGVAIELTGLAAVWLTFAAGKKKPR
jgi:hypothetical protein